jgi:hypothetical protein
MLPRAWPSTAERTALLPLLLSPWELAEWKQAKLHADCHIVFGNTYYSASHRLIGERLSVRAAGSKIELFTTSSSALLGCGRRPIVNARIGRT